MKIALIYSFNESNWFSCTKIVKNLLYSYELALKGHDIIPMNYNMEDPSFSIIDLVTHLKNEKPEKIVFLDHKPHPLAIFKKLESEIPNYLPEIYVHIFGDFTLNFSAWISSAKYLKGKKVKFFCASDAQVELVQKCLSSKEHSIKKVPFPVLESEFSFKDSSIDIRKKYSLSSDETIFLYTGRLSMQKKVLDLIDVFSSSLENGVIPKNSTLLFAGSFDSLGFIFGNVWEEEGEMFRSYDKKIKSKVQSTQNKIKYIGMIDNSELCDYYNDSNYFISLSTYHDEDYGMSVAEAGSCGTPLILSDWAGFKSFNINENCFSVKTYIGKEEPKIDIDAAKEIFKKLPKVDCKKRERSARDFKVYCSVEAVGKVLKKEIFNESVIFENFNDFMANLSRLNSLNNILFYDDYNKCLNQNYRELYESYYSKD
jgi:glycosyltransferase involved in cell wall biosynthesis